MERELGISYPTVRNRVEALVKTLGLGDAPVPSEPVTTVPGSAGASQRRQVLERLARHEITAEQAAAQLRGERAEVASPAQSVAPAEPGEPSEPAEPAEPQVPAELATEEPSHE